MIDYVDDTWEFPLSRTHYLREALQFRSSDLQFEARHCHCPLGYRSHGFGCYTKTASGSHDPFSRTIKRNVTTSLVISSCSQPKGKRLMSLQNWSRIYLQICLGKILRISRVVRGAENLRFREVQ